MNDFNVVLKYHQSEIIGQSLGQNNIKYDYYIKGGNYNLQRLFLFLLITI